jgi:transposase-like protein
MARRRAAQTTNGGDEPTFTLSEAEHFIELIRLKRTTAMQARKDIGTATPYRRKILARFEMLLEEQALIPRMDKPNNLGVPIEVRDFVERSLRDGVKYSVIQALANVPYEFVKNVSKETGALYCRQGRGRRIPKETRNKIIAAIRERKMRISEIARQFGVTVDTIYEYRQKLGDRENRKHWRKLTPEQVAFAKAALARGEKWESVAQDLGVSTRTLLKTVRYRKHGDLVARRQALAAEIVSLRQSSMHVSAIARKLKIGERSVRRCLQVSLCSGLKGSLA